MGIAIKTLYLVSVASQARSRSIIGSRWYRSQIAVTGLILGGDCCPVWQTGHVLVWLVTTNCLREYSRVCIHGNNVANDRNHFVCV